MEIAISPRIVRGFAFVSTKAVLVRKSRRTFRTHKPKAPSGRELPTKSGEGERVTIKLVQIQSYAGSFRHATQRTPKAHFIRFGEPLPSATVSLRLGHARALTPHRGVIHYPRAASLPPGGRLCCRPTVHLKGVTH